MVIKILIPIIIILVLFFTIYYKKSYQEHFSNFGKLEINFNIKDSIFMISDNLKNVTQTERGTIFKKSKDLIHSSDLIYSEDGTFQGFIFSIKPGNKMDPGKMDLGKMDPGKMDPVLGNKMKIGFSNMLEDKKNEIGHCFNILDENTFEIIERVTGTKNYVKENIDYCLDGQLEICYSTKNKFKFDPRKNMLAIVFNQDKVNYLIISRNDDGGYGSMLIHKGTNAIKYPYNLKVICHDDEVLLPTLLWAKKNIVYESPVYWSVETKFKDQYDKEKLEIAPGLSPVAEPPSLLEDASNDDEKNNYYSAFAPGESGIRITEISKILNEDNIVLIFEHNLDNSDIEDNKDNLYVRIYSDETTFNVQKFNDLDSIKRKIPFIGTIFQVQIKIGDIESNKFIPEEITTTTEILIPPPSPGPS